MSPKCLPQRWGQAEKPKNESLTGIFSETHFSKNPSVAGVRHRIDSPATRNFHRGSEHLESYVSAMSPSRRDAREREFNDLAIIKQCKNRGKGRLTGI
jgi:hypothetical protein